MNIWLELYAIGEALLKSMHELVERPKMFECLDVVSAGSSKCDWGRCPELAFVVKHHVERRMISHRTKWLVLEAHGLVVNWLSWCCPKEKTSLDIIWNSYEEKMCPLIDLVDTGDIEEPGAWIQRCKDVRMNNQWMVLFGNRCCQSYVLKRFGWIMAHLDDRP